MPLISLEMYGERRMFLGVKSPSQRAYAAWTTPIFVETSDIKKDLKTKGFDLEDVKLKVVLPQKEVDDRGRETKADTDEIRSGLNAPSIVAQARGKSFEDICKTLAKDMKTAEKYGIVFDWMVSKVNKSGAYHNSDLALENPKKEPEENEK